MKANELRIGNWVLDAISNKIERADYLTIKILVDEDDVYEHIPLTEEWLLKFGFQIKDQLSIHKTKVYYISGIDVDYCLYFADFRQDFGFYIEYTDSPFDKDLGVLYPIAFGIKYVHQLQNLYFALTGEELTSGDSK